MMQVYFPHLPNFHIKNVFRSKFLFLFVSAVLLIFVSPYFLASPFGRLFLGVTSSLVLVAVVFTTLEKRHLFVTACFISTATIILNAAQLYFGGVFLEASFSVMSLVFYTLAIVVIFKEILKGKEITPNILFGSLSVYLLIGLAYASAYATTEILSPGSFQFSNTPNDLIDRFNITYFSFTTLTTVGFGDVVPVAIHAKSIVILEEITGVLYLAALVSRLVAGMR